MRPRTTVLVAALALLAAAAPAAAQNSDPTLARVDSLLDATRLTEARNTLDRWLASSAGRERQGDVAAHALLLRARLTTSSDTALPLYLELALNHPASRFAPAALLRLGQGYLASGEVDRAEGYLQRLVRDYPAFDQRATGFLWLARAQRALRRTGDACATLDRALTDAPRDPALRELLQQERALCTANAAPAAKPATPTTSANAAQTPAAQRTGSGNYTVQIGAFRDHAAARALAQRLRARDIDARVVRIGEGTLAMVRAGRFVRSSDAADLLRRVRTIVPDAVITSDAARERAITQ